MANSELKIAPIARAKDDWGISYPRDWPVLNPYADEARKKAKGQETKEQRAKLEAANELPLDPFEPDSIVYYGPLEEGQEYMEIGATEVVGYGDPSVPTDEERRSWVGLAALGECSLKLTVGEEVAANDAKPDHIDEKALLKQWPVMVHTRGSSGADKGISEICKFMTAKNYDPDWADEWVDAGDIIPEQFVKLTVKDSVKSAHLAVAVAMLLGWLPAEMSCPKCGGSMRLVEEPDYMDNLHWRCNEDGKTKGAGKASKKGKKANKAAERCNVRKKVRYGTWMETSNANLGRILLAIYYWEAGVKEENISKWTVLAPKTIQKITKACRLIAANFMVANPNLNKIGGPGITVQIDETFTGKMKYKKGKPRIQTWVLGAIEDPETLPDHQTRPKSFSITVPNRTRATLIPILKSKIKEGTKIHSDGWRAYFTLGSHGYTWDWVNHSEYFKDPSTGVHTNRIEGYWKHMKKCIPHGTRRRIVEEYVQLHNFREFCKSHSEFGKLGVFGLLGRAASQVKLLVKQGNRIHNMFEAIKIVTRNPLPVPPPAPQKPQPTKRSRGRPPKRRGRGRGRRAGKK